jgi:hypothetical protein
LFTIFSCASLAGFPHITALHGAFYKSCNVYILMEYMDAGSLDHLLAKHVEKVRSAWSPTHARTHASPYASPYASTYASAYDDTHALTHACTHAQSTHKYTHAHVHSTHAPERARTRANHTHHIPHQFSQSICHVIITQSNERNKHQHHRNKQTKPNELTQQINPIKRTHQNKQTPGGSRGARARHLCGGVLCSARLAVLTRATESNAP